jgi:hypothetical protein
MNLQAFSIERVATFLTPFFAAGATAFTGYLATHTGTHIDPNAVEGVEIAAFVGTVGIVAKWLHGRQIPEIAGLKITPQQLDQLHAEVGEYLKANPQLKIDEEQLVQTVLSRLAGVAAAKPAATTSA